MKKSIIAFVLLASLVPVFAASLEEPQNADIIVSLQDAKDNCRLIMYDSTPQGDADSACASFAVFAGNPKVLVGTYQTLGEALQNIPDSESLKEIQLAWGQNFLKKFHSRSEAEKAVDELEKSTGPRDLGLRLIRAALPTMNWGGDEK